MTDDELRLLLATLTQREVVELCAVNLPRPAYAMARLMCSILPETSTELLSRLGTMLTCVPRIDHTRHIDAPFLDAVEDLLEDHLLLLCGHSTPGHIRRPLRDLLKTLPRYYLHSGTISAFNAALEILVECWPRDRATNSRVTNERWSQLIMRSSKALATTREGHGTADARYAAYGKILDAWLLL